MHGHLPRRYDFILALTVIPFATAILSAAAIRLDPRLERAARDLGETGAAHSIGVILSLADLSISMFPAGRVQPLSLIVASQFRRELSPDLNAIQAVVLILTALLVAANELMRARRSPLPAHRGSE